MLKRLTAFLAGLAAALTISLAAPAAEYPTHPVTILVAFTPGGPSDVLARIVGKRLQEILHQPFIIENRPGSGGNIAAEQASHAAPDGYTLLMGNNSILATNAALYKKLAYDPEKDFIPISLIGTQANILVVNPAVPANSMAELIALAKASPGKLNFASSGFGAAAHLAGELFKTEAKINIVHVALQGRGAGAAGRHGRPCADDVRHRGFGDRADQERQGARARRDHAEAHRAVAGPADRGRARHQGLRRHHLAWPGGAGRHAEGDHRHAELRHRRRR